MHKSRIIMPDTDKILQRQIAPIIVQEILEFQTNTLKIFGEKKKEVQKLHKVCLIMLIYAKVCMLQTPYCLVGCAVSCEMPV